MTNKLVVVINSLKVPKIKKIVLYEMKFLCTKLQLPPEPLTRGLPPQIPDLSVLCLQLNLLNPPPKKFLGTPLIITEPRWTYLRTDYNKQYEVSLIWNLIAVTITDNVIFSWCFLMCESKWHWVTVCSQIIELFIHFFRTYMFGINS